jgi:hypothetical protein
MIMTTVSDRVNIQETPPDLPTDRIDWRQQLFNKEACGPIQQVSLAEDRIVELKGILLDVDQRLLKAGPLLPEVPIDPVQFYERVLSPLLNHNDVLRRAEVRNSGQGLHVILRPASPIVLNAERDRRKWKASLPTDPRAPAIHALTRPIGSLNSKSNSAVTQLAAGEQLPVTEIEAFAHAMRNKPFASVLKNLTGSDHMRPCPICRGDDSDLSALDKVGRCYKKCGTVKLAQLYDCMFAPPANSGKGK